MSGHSSVVETFNSRGFRDFSLKHAMLAMADYSVTPRIGEPLTPDARRHAAQSSMPRLVLVAVRPAVGPLAICRCVRILTSSCFASQITAPSRE
jgi:hypothetical protein